VGDRLRDEKQALIDTEQICFFNADMMGRFLIYIHITLVYDQNRLKVQSLSC